MNRWLLFAAVLYASIPPSIGDSAETPSLTIVCIGDSLTAAEGVKPENGFPALLDRRLADVRVVQQGRSGWPTTAYLRRIDEVLAELPVDVDLILLQLGANDLRVHGHNKETVEQAAANMSVLMDRFRAKAPRAKFVFVAPPTMIDQELTKRLRDAGFGAQSSLWLEQLGTAFRKTAKEKGCGYIDLYPLLKSGDTVDGAHPNEKGHAKIADAVWKWLPDTVVRRK